MSPFGRTRFSTWLGAVPVSVAAAELPPTTVPIDSVVAGPVAPVAPTGPATPCGPTPPLVVMLEVDDDTVAETPCCVTVAEIGADVTVTDVLTDSGTPRSAA